jgi:hypothetical protein
MTQTDWEPYRDYVTDLWNLGYTAPQITSLLELEEDLEVSYVLSSCSFYFKRSNVNITGSTKLNTF